MQETTTGHAPKATAPTDELITLIVKYQCNLTTNIIAPLNIMYHRSKLIKKYIDTNGIDSIEFDASEDINYNGHINRLFTAHIEDEPILFHSIFFITLPEIEILRHLLKVIKFFDIESSVYQFDGEMDNSTTAIFNEYDYNFNSIVVPKIPKTQVHNSLQITRSEIPDSVVFENNVIDQSIRHFVINKMIHIFNTFPPEPEQKINLQEHLQRHLQEHDFTTSMAIKIEEFLYERVIQKIHENFTVQSENNIIYEDIAREFLLNLDPESHVRNETLLQRIYTECLLNVGSYSSYNLFPMKNAEIISELEKRQNFTRTYKPVFSTLYKCPMCEKYEVIFHSVQSRSADEPASMALKCWNCKYEWKRNL